MEETVVPKRPREAQIEKDLDFEEYTKKHKPYNQIISLLDSEEEESNEDLSPLITTLQQEITCDIVSNPNTLLMSSTQDNDQNNLVSCDANIEVGLTSNTPIVLKEEEEEDDKEKVMRHLLQATDDELGIPNIGDGLMGFGDHGFHGGDEFSSLCYKLWELEDERANYYDLLQSELFLWGH